MRGTYPGNPPALEPSEVAREPCTHSRPLHRLEPCRVVAPLPRRDRRARPGTHPRGSRVPDGPGAPPSATSEPGGGSARPDPDRLHLCGRVPRTALAHRTAVRNTSAALQRDSGYRRRARRCTHPCRRLRGRGGQNGHYPATLARRDRPGRRHACGVQSRQRRPLPSRNLGRARHCEHRHALAHAERRAA